MALNGEERIQWRNMMHQDGIHEKKIQGLSQICADMLLAKHSIQASKVLLPPSEVD
jgi:hypothetical protein